MKLQTHDFTYFLSNFFDDDSFHNMLVYQPTFNVMNLIIIIIIIINMRFLLVDQREKMLLGLCYYTIIFISQNIMIMN